MTPHQEIKANWGYIRTAPICANCMNFEPSKVLSKGGILRDIQDINTCSIGGFPVSTKAYCTRLKSIKSNRADEEVNKEHQ